MKKILIIALMCCVCAEARAQQEEAEFTADRPGASTGPSVVGHHVVQLEQGSLKYDVDYSIVGTQSCNGRIPINGASKLYLGFENVRMRYTNYLWVEAVAVIPTTESYRTQSTVE